LCSLENRAAKIIGINSVKSMIDSVEKQICEFVKNSIKKDFQHPIFDNYYDVISHGKMTRNNNCSLRFPQVKLQNSKQGLSYGGVKVFNNLTIVERRKILL